MAVITDEEHLEIQKRLSSNVMDFSRKLAWMTFLRKSGAYKACWQSCSG